MSRQKTTHSRINEGTAIIISRVKHPAGSSVNSDCFWAFLTGVYNGSLWENISRHKQQIHMTQKIILHNYILY